MFPHKMNTILQRRRGAAEDNDGVGHVLEEGNFRMKSADDNDDNNNNGNNNASSESESIEESSKQWRQQRRLRWQRSNIWNWNKFTCKFKCATVVVAVVIFYLAVQKVVVHVLLQNKPRLPIPNVDIEVPNANDWPLVHIVQSRFMQEQGPLETLGMARLKLFLTFCLPSMVQQSSQDFFWIIKADPQFTKTSVFDLLIRSVRSHDNIYVVASNANFLFGSAGREGSWRDGKVR